MTKKYQSTHRIRTTKPDFYKDSKVGSLSIPARHLFQGTWSIADDEGLLLLNSLYISSEIFPYDRIDTDVLAGYIQEVINSGLIVKYKSRQGDEIGWIVNFRKHQRIDRPNGARYALPPTKCKSVVSAYARRDDFKCKKCGGEIPDEEMCAERVDENIDYNPSNVSIYHKACIDVDKTKPITSNISAIKKVNTENENESEPDKIFSYWCLVMNKKSARLTDKRKKLISDRLKEGYSAEEIMTAIDGCRKSEFNMGKNRTNTVYDDLTLICRSGDKLEHYKNNISTLSEDRENEIMDWATESINE